MEKSAEAFRTISEVSELLQTPAHVLRFWEKEFDIIKPKKNKKGNRLFTKEDVDNFKQIYQLVKESGFTLNGAKLKLKEMKSVDTDKDGLRSTLLGIRESLLELKDKI